MSTVPLNVVRTAGRGGLQWSDYIYLGGFMVAAVVTVDPLHMRLVHDGPTRHLALLLTLPAVALTVTGRRLATARRGAGLRETAAAAWPLLALAVVIIAGALYARFERGIYDTFLNLGLYMLMVPCAALMVTHTQDPDALLRRLTGILAAAAAVMGVLLVYYYGSRHVYHDQIFLVIPPAVWFFMMPRRRWAAWLGTAALLATAVFSAKNTSYLMALMVGGYLAAAVGLPRLRNISGPRRLLAGYAAFVVLVAVALGGAWLFAHRADYLPTGNVTYRSHTYAAALSRFAASPLAGSLFAASSVHKFDLYTIDIAGGRLPTHSDILDILANGGLIGIGLWAGGLARIARLAYRRVLAPRHRAHPWATYGHMLAAVAVGGILTYAFNPVLLDPAMAFLWWGSVGTLLGLSLRAGERGARAAVPARSGT